MHIVKHIVYMVAFSLAIIACTPVTTETIDMNIPIVEAYLQPGTNIDHIQITKLISYISDSEGATPLNELEVYLKHESDSFKLELLEGDSGYYYYPDSNLIVEAGQEWSISFNYNGHEVTASTLVPSKPSNFAASQTSISLEKMEEGSKPSIGEEEDVELTWDLDDNQYYYLKIENLEDDPETIMEWEDDEDMELPTTSLTEPENVNVRTLRSRQFSYFGTYRIILYSVNQEYVDMYENTGTSSITLGEPLTNISNGKGIFTSYNSDTLYLEVNEE